MKTHHETIFSNAKRMSRLGDESVDLVITSPPYPMIDMWDELFSEQSRGVKAKLRQHDGPGAFELMHQLLDAVWQEVYRVVKPGGVACINIGDAVRTINGNFVLYTNHARILRKMEKLGFGALPCILWRKQTNAPNKFMGSGMLPAGAYVTLEHEYILIFRKGGKREFTQEADKKNRRQSALFWEERNLWFSDIWFDVKGTPQALNQGQARKRSAAYPFELAYRLINMYSVKRDLVLDPFLGIGTTMAAAMASGRNSIGYEIDPNLRDTVGQIADVIVHTSKTLIRQRLRRHVEFVTERVKSKGKLKHLNRHYGFPVITAQEKELLFSDPLTVTRSARDVLEVAYADKPQTSFVRERTSDPQKNSRLKLKHLPHPVTKRQPEQRSLF